MPQTRPLIGHPEFSITNHPGYREYRVDNFYVARDGSGRIVRKATGFSTYCAFAPVLLALSKFCGPRWFGFWALVTLVLVYEKVTQVVAATSTNFLVYDRPSETVLVIPRHGIQLETHRGLPSQPFFSSKRFIPLRVLRDIVINEGLRGWNVRYYLAAVENHPLTGFALDVAFEVRVPCVKFYALLMLTGPGQNTLPRLSILLEVYRGTHDLLFMKNEGEGESGESGERTEHWQSRDQSMQSVHSL
ncbi:hypothetical protein AN958_11288 [Leucoagaricus sp. SymC.cos]|nr:hypothetical protein AN958_11288 [Leucoagaricus sp. SymC.cos]